MLAILRHLEGRLRRGKNFWLQLTTASAQCLRLSGRFFHYVMYSVECLCFVVVICLKHGLMFAGAGAEDLCWLLLVDIHHSSSSTSTPLTHCLYSAVYIYLHMLLIFNSYCTVPLQQLDCDSVTLIMFIHSFIHSLHTAFILFLHCTLASCGAVYCNRCFLCVCVCVFVCLFVYGSVTTITRDCVHRSSPNWVCR